MDTTFIAGDMAYYNEDQTLFFGPFIAMTANKGYLVLDAINNETNPSDTRETVIIFKDDLGNKRRMLMSRFHHE